MNPFSFSRSAALTGAAALVCAAGLLAAGCGSSSDSSASTAGERAAAAPQQVTLNAMPRAETTIQEVASAVGETVVYSVACSPGDTWQSVRLAPLITKKSPDVPTTKECVDGTRKWAFINLAPGVENIVFNGVTAPDRTAMRATVKLTIAGDGPAPEPKSLTLTVGDPKETPAGQDVTLATGDTLVVTAQCSASEGTKWDYRYPAAKSSVIVKSTTVTPPFACVTPEGADPGTPGQQQFAFDAKGPGTVRVGFFERGPDKALIGRGAVNFTVE